MRVDVNTLRVGNLISHKGRICRVVKTQHVKPGKGGAFLQCELRDVSDSTKLNERFRASEGVERVRLEERPFQFLYRDSGTYTFMDVGSYDQLSLEESSIGSSQCRFLQEGMEVLLGIHEGKALTVSLPETVVLEVVEAEAVVRGQTQTSTSKPAVLENGVRLMVPPYVLPGMKVSVHVQDEKFVERVKSSSS